MLIVDESTEDIFSVRRGLEKAGIKNPVVTFSDAEPVVSFLRATSVRNTCEPSLKPAAVFIDAKLPRRSFARILDWMVEASAMEKILVVVTARDPEDRSRAKGWGVKHFTSKSPTKADLSPITSHIALRAR